MSDVTVPRIGEKPLKRVFHREPTDRVVGIVRVLVAVSIAVAIVMAWQRLHDAAATVFPLLWTFFPLLFVHGLQLVFSAAAWSGLLAAAQTAPVSRRLLFRLRVIREGVDSILPVAQIGGELIASSTLIRSGIGPAVAVGGIIVDMLAEFLGQLAYLALACLLLSGQPHRQVWPIWLSLGSTVVLTVAAFVTAQRFGILKLVENITSHLARHVSDVPTLRIAGLHETVMQMVARPRSVGAAVLLHFLHWLLGAVEVWIVLHAMGLSVGPCQAIIMNAIGQAARSAGFAVPGSLVVQESGFMLGATLAGLPPQSALVFSLIRRVRELVVGGVGVALWQCSRPQVPDGSLPTAQFVSPVSR